MATPAVLATKLTEEHARELAALEEVEARRLLKLYDQARANVAARLAMLPGKNFTAQQHRIVLAQITEGLRTLNAQLSETWSEVLNSRLQRAVTQTLQEITQYEPTLRKAQGAIQTSVVRHLAQPKKLLLSQFKASIATYGTGVVRDVSGQLALKAIEKAPWRDVARTVSKTIRDSRWRAERIVRTEFIHAMNVGHQAALEGSAEMLPGLKRQWDATLDTRTSNVCRTLNGQVRGVRELFVADGKSHAHPPAHPNCRSRVLPWREEWVELSDAAPPSPKPTRAERDRRLAQERVARRRTIETAEAEIRDNDIETAVVVKPDGSVGLRKSGGRSSVSFTSAEAEAMAGCTLTHNHPSGLSFSPDDIQLACRRGLAEMRAVGREFTYVMLPPKSRPWSKDFWDREIAPAAKRADEEAFADLAPRVRRGELSREAASLEHWHRIWKQVSKLTGIRYSRKAQ